MPGPAQLDNLAASSFDYSLSGFRNCALRSPPRRPDRFLNRSNMRQTRFHMYVYRRQRRRQQCIPEALRRRSPLTHSAILYCLARTTCCWPDALLTLARTRRTRGGGNAYMEAGSVQLLLLLLNARSAGTRLTEVKASQLKSTRRPGCGASELAAGLGDWIYACVGILD